MMWVITASSFFSKELHKGGIWVIGALALGVGSLAVNLVLHLLRIGNLRSLLFVREAKTTLTQLRSSVILSCDHGTVSAHSFDRANNQEVSTALWTGGLTWRSGPEPVNRVKQRASRQIMLRTTLFVGLFLPLFAGGIAAGVLVDWKLLLIPALLILHQFMPFYIWDYPGVSELV